MATTFEHADGDERRAEVRDALARYPNINDAELSDLLRWFRKEATALEAAMLASEPGLARSYQRLKAEHLDRLSGAELFWTATFVILVVSILIVVALNAA